MKIPPEVLFCIIGIIGAAAAFTALDRDNARPPAAIDEATTDAEIPLPPLGSCMRAELLSGDSDRCITFTSQCNRVCWGISSAIAAVQWRDPEDMRCVCAGRDGVDVFTDGFTAHERVMETEVLCVDPE